MTTTLSPAPAAVSGILTLEDDETPAPGAVSEIVMAHHAWATSNGRFWSPTPTATKLPAGVYTVGMSQRLGAYLDQMKVVKDNLVILPDMGADVVLEEIGAFFAKADRYKARKMVHKRGILMVGPPGSGKTSNSELLVELFVGMFNGLVIATQDIGSIATGLGLIRSREPDRPVMVLMEDIDGMIKGGGEEVLLNLLDGKQQYDGVVYVATTNYLDKLPDRIANRPSRFDLVVEIGLPTPKAREAYLKHVEPDMPQTQIDAIVKVTDNYSVAHLKELLILTELYEMPLERATSRIGAIMAKKLLPGVAKFQLEKVPAAFGIHDLGE